MIPWVVGRELRATLLDYLRSTWSIADRELEAALFTFLSGPNGLFQGPYLRVGLPFAPAPRDVALPLDIVPPYPPHLHQLEAWQRLSSRGRTPEATLITTGTGSGKTECFLFPLLDHALREAQRGTPGIKAIVLYPMNALASDQAGRFASTIWNDERLRGRVRVGLFVGGEGGQHREMGREHVIDDNDRLRASPPDILLTNYRMLDLLLQRPKDARLWAHNQKDTLRYLVLDELHTYDGAQGTDVACLIRRLSQRLGSAESLCPVGTSATIGGSSDTRAALLRFAGVLFDQPFDDSAFIGETRLEPRDLGADQVWPEATPSVDGPWPQPGEKAEAHVAACVRAWLPEPAQAAVLREAGRIDRLALGEAIVRLPIIEALLEVAHQKPRSAGELEAALAQRLPRFAAGSTLDRQGWMASALSLLSYAQRSVGGTILPLVSVQATIWVREVRRLLCRVGGPPAFRFHDDAPPPEGEAWLPRYTCQDCGHGGWLVSESGPGDTLGLDYATVARAFQERSEDLRLLHLDRALSEDPDDPVDANTASDAKPGAVATAVRVAYLDAKARRLLDKSPDDAPLPEVRVALFEDKKCPGCGGRNSLRMLAARSTTLSSVAVGHLFTTPLNTDRKLLTFSDSVQDAAHRAGFFGARTYRFALRSAMLAAVPQNAGIPLADLGAAVWEHWIPRLGQKPGLSAQAELTALLLPVDLHWLTSVVSWHADLDEMVRRQGEAEKAGESPPIDVPDPSPALVSDVKRRLGWECTRELGVAARIGRTLEQSGTLSVTVDASRFEAAASDMRVLLKEKLGLFEPSDAAVRHWIAGVLTRMRLRGGVYDELLKGYIATAGTGFFLSKSKAPLLSPFSRESSRPLFLTNAPKSKRFESITSPHKGTWAIDWLVRSLGVARDASLGAQVYGTLLPILTKQGILIATPTEEHGFGAGVKATAWGLDPAALLVSRAHVFRRCQACGYELAAVEGSPTDPLGHPCLRYRCPGTFFEVTETPADGDELPVASYYKRFYERGQLGRLWAREHTGLLARGPREELELEFKQRPRPDSPNLLSCTPTLEMGIDIGDLSATLLCSVPPRSSNYVQRVGRAGRKTGNALVLAFAATRPHDLHFFQDPLEAMAGAIHPPGCYLSAPEVLKRQALAFVFDGYAREGGTLPGRVDDLWKPGDKKRFPDPVLEFIAPRRAQLERAFTDMFGSLTVGAKAEVSRYFAVTAEGTSPLEQKLVMVTAEARQRREELRRLAQRLDEASKLLKTDEVAQKKVLDLEDELRRLDDERRFVGHQLKSLGTRDLFGWLTEEGCLPNYAFPERGVKLDAYIRREGIGNEPEHYEWVRSPASAITELAPFNTFYASSRRVKIDGVELRQGAKPIAWRFCRNCHHAEHVSTEADPKAACPSCGDERFADVGLRRSILPLGQVFAVAQHRDAVLGDDADDRDRSFYEGITLFESKAKAREAWSNDAAGFGFELQDELVLRQLNLGLKPRGTPHRFQIAGQERPDVGFVLCETCGQAHDPDPTANRGTPRAKHRGWCAERKKPEDKQVFREVHLLRELRSEALRLVLPLAGGGGAEGDIANLRAALRLGLRRFYGGEPDFLDVKAYDEPLLGDEGRRRYLVVMDQVPGGTGLLADLALNKGASLKQALTDSYEAMRTCSCRLRTPAVAACYQCLYAYREQGDLKHLNRLQAMSLVGELLEAFGGLRKVDTIGTMSQSEVLESELEHRFVASLIARVSERGGKVIEKGDGQWQVSVGPRTWLLRAQVELGADRVAVPCRADFMFYPEEKSDVKPGVHGAKPIAVFTDGLAYHVFPSQDTARLADDARKRMGISSGGEHWTWSLTWKDVVSPDAPVMPGWVGDGSAYTQLQAAAFKVDGQANAAEKLGTVLRVLDADPVRGLVSVLEAPTRLPILARLVAFLQLQPVRRLDKSRTEALRRAARGESEPPSLPVLSGEGEMAVREIELGAHAHAWLDVPHQHLGKLMADPRDLQVTVRLEDDRPARNAATYETSWRQWLRAWNVFQTLPGAMLTTREGTQEEWQAPPEPTALVEVVAVAPLDARLSVLKEVTDREAAAVLEQLLLKHPGLAAPSVPLEVRGTQTDGDLELGWRAQRVAAYFDRDRALAESLEAAGWSVFALERGLDLVALELALKVR